MDLIFITPTLVLRAQAVFGWGICLYRDGVRELHIFCGGFGMIRIPGPDMDERTRQAWNLTVRAAPTHDAETTSARRTR